MQKFVVYLRLFISLLYLLIGLFFIFFDFVSSAFSSEIYKVGFGILISLYGIFRFVTGVKNLKNEN